MGFESTMWEVAKSRRQTNSRMSYYLDINDPGGHPPPRTRKTIMYEMYPDAWPTVVDQHPQTGPADKPRRRVRKEHSVIPPVLDRQGTAPRSPDLDR